MNSVTTLRNTAYKLSDMVIRPLNEEDEIQTAVLDELSGNHVVPWLDSDLSYGLFFGDRLIGYLTIGYADACTEEIEEHPLHTCDSRLLSDVFLLDEFRGKGLGKILVEHVVRLSEETVFLYYLEDDLELWYASMNFKKIGDGVMMRTA